MEPEDSVFFHQNQLPCLSFAVFEDMRKKRELCDFTITVQDYSFTAHRVIIAAVIPFFRSLFTPKEGYPEEEEITLDDLDPKALKSVIDFAYSNKISISDQTVQSLLLTSNFLQLDQVRDACVEYQSQRLHINNVVKVRAIALRIKNFDLIESTNQYIQKNFEELSKTEEFLDLSSACLKEIISKDELNLTSEEIVFEAIIRWVRFSPSKRQSLLPELLCEVRMIYIPQDYLSHRILLDELISASKLCVGLIEEARDYQISKREGASLKIHPRKIDGMYAVCYCYTSGVSVHYADFANNTWHHLASEMEYDVVYHAIAVKEKIYLFLEEAIRIFQLKTLEWEQLPSKHQYLCGAAVSSHDDIIYFFGSAHHNFRDRQRFFDTQQNKWLKEGKMTKGWCNSSATTLGSSIYVTGGCRRFLMGRKFPTSSNGSKSVEKYNTLTGQSCEITPMLIARERHGSVALDGKVYVCGGYNAVTDRYSVSAEVYDPLTRQWKLIAKVNKKMSFVSLILYSGKIFAVGSNNEDDPATIEIYDPIKDQWESVFCGPRGFRRVVSICSSSN